MDFIIKKNVLRIEYELDEQLKDKVIFYFDNSWDGYRKIVVFSSIEIKEKALLINGVFCDIPKEFKNNNKIICYVVGVDKDNKRIVTNKAVLERNK